MGDAMLTLMLATGFALQPVGTFHDGETVARDGESWLALDTTSGPARLSPTRVRLTRVHDAVVDGDGEATGIEVAAIDAPEPTMLLRGPRLRAGAVELAERLDDAALRGGEFAAVRFRGLEYRIQARCPSAPPSADDEAGQACDVVLTDGTSSQALSSTRRWRTAGGGVTFGDDVHPHLVQAGDFDGDGRLDLILDTSSHYPVSRPTLFLSSPASDGERVRQVATYESIGC